MSAPQASETRRPEVEQAGERVGVAAFVLGGGEQVGELIAR